MSDHCTYVCEIEKAISGKAIGTRAEALRRVTDLFVSAATEYTEREVAIFDEVMVRLVVDLEISLRAMLAARLASIPNAPQKLIRILAADSAIEIAGPVLRMSERLDDPTLVENAKAGSQKHLLAISKRTCLREPVTDVLVELGDQSVTLSTAENAGARFSDLGRRTLLARAEGDDSLAVEIWRRTDIPRQQLLKLFSLASEGLRQKLELVDRQKANIVGDMLRDIANEFQAEWRTRSRDYAEAERFVTALCQNGELNEAKVAELAEARRFEETTVALSLLCDLPIGACERAMVQDRAELILLLAKAIGLSWTTTKRVLSLRAGPGGVSSAELTRNLNTFTRLQSEAAGKGLRFLRMRECARIFSTARPS